MAHARQLSGEAPPGIEELEKSWAYEI
jgi:hypothetical protein